MGNEVLNVQFFNFSLSLFTVIHFLNNFASSATMKLIWCR